MKITCSKLNLLQGVINVSKAVSNKSTYPILECILINADNEYITLTGNDTELGIETKIQGTINESGKIALEAKLLLEIVKKLPDYDITIETNENYQAIITCQKAKFTISGQSGNDFTELPFIVKEKYITLSQFTLKEIIRQTIFSISDNENNKLMTGELFEIKNNYLTVASLDGHRISIRKIPLTSQFEDIKIVVPGKTLSDLSKILTGDTDKNVTIYFNNRHIMFEFDSTIVVSRLLEGEYYKISQMLSSDYETKIKINKKELLNCIDRASLLIKESDKKPIIINILNNKMELKINSSIGSMNEDIEILKDGKDILIGFNPKFLIEALRVIDDEEINIYLVNPKAPCFIKDDKENYIYLILPVNFNTENY